ncbi:MAG: molybdenum cofactor guanylyltransferase, partial [Gemmatimonadales bacterium]
AILAGGRASRYGGAPKGLETVGGQRILDRLVDVFTMAFGDPPFLVANDPSAPRWLPNLEVVGDIRRDAGSLGGIHTALATTSGSVVCVAWDMPFVPPALLQELAAGLDRYDAVLPASSGRRGVEPLCAAYGPACLPAVESALDRGDLRAIGFHSGVNVGILPLQDVARHGDPEVIFFNVNLPDDRARAEVLWRQQESFR